MRKKTSSKHEHVDLVGGSCYGKQRLKKLISGGYEGLCKYPCRLMESCISASREEKENVERQLSYIPLDDRKKSSADERFDSDGAPIEYEQGEFKELLESIDLDEITNTEDAKSGRKKSDFYHKLLRRYGKNIDKETLGSIYPAFREVVAQFLYEFVHMPKKITVDAGAAVSDMNQSELARREGVTRQAINAAIKVETGKFLPTGTVIPDCLEGREKIVYQLCFVDGCSTRSAAIQSGLSHMTIQRVLQLIRSKIGKNVTLKKNRRKKIKKNRRTKKRIERDRQKQLEADAKAWREFQKRYEKGCRRLMGKGQKGQKGQK